jgi:hypothetical protein
MRALPEMAIGCPRGSEPSRTGWWCTIARKTPNEITRFTNSCWCSLLERMQAEEFPLTTRENLFKMWRTPVFRR